MEKTFINWTYRTVQELELLARTLPVISRDKAELFFRKAGEVVNDAGKPGERKSGKIFDNLNGFIEASDRKDFAATWDIENQRVSQGVLFLETFDSVIPFLFCAVRVSEDSFLTRAYIQGNRTLIKEL